MAKDRAKEETKEKEAEMQKLVAEAEKIEREASAVEKLVEDALKKAE